MCQKVGKAFECGHEDTKAPVKWTPSKVEDCPMAVTTRYIIDKELQRCLPGNCGNYTTALFTITGVCKECRKDLKTGRNTWCPRCKVYLAPSSGDFRCRNCEFVVKEGASK